MFKRNEHRGHVLLQFIPLLPVQIQPEAFRFPQRSFDYKKHEQVVVPQ